MSRTDPYKKKRRSAKSTLLVFGEGLCEEMFLKHLRRLYSKDAGVHVTVMRGKGGTAYAVAADAHRADGAFDRRVAVIDNDKGSVEMEEARRYAAERGIELIENSPCLEALLLSILGQVPGEHAGSAACKAAFESGYIGKKKRGEPDEYARVFPRALLEKSRKKVEGLNALIILMEGPSPE